MTTTSTTKSLPASLETLSRPEVVKNFPVGSTIMTRRYSKTGSGYVFVEATLLAHEPHITEVAGFGTDTKRRIRPVKKGPRRYYEKAETWNNSSVGFFLRLDDGEEIVTKDVYGDPAGVRSLARKAAQARKEQEQRTATVEARRAEQDERILSGLASLGLIERNEDGDCYKASRNSYRNQWQYEIDADILDALVAKVTGTEADAIDVE